jgi:geranylgeranyl pyrophosphate synthase
MAQSTALLAGDILLSDAYLLLSKVAVADEFLRPAIKIFANGVFEVVGGELLDSESGFLNSVSAEVIARYKTASYSFISPITMGATLGGASQHEVRLLKQFSEYLGVGYQLRDDLLGVFGDGEKTGKVLQQTSSKASRRT